MKRTTVTIIVALLFTHFCYSQCDCSELLKYGLYNHFSNTSQVENYSKVSESISDMYTKGKSETTGVGGNYGAFGATFNQNQATSLNKLVTTNNLSEEEGKEIITTSSSYISPEMISAYKACLALCDKSGLNFKADIPSDAYAEKIIFTFSYRKIIFGDKVPRIKDIVLLPLGCYECTGSLLELMNDTLPLNESEPYTLRCIRKISNTSFLKKGSENVYIKAEDALIQIETSMGNYTVRIPPIYSQIDRSKNVGEIVSTMLSKEEFIKQNGTDYWMLADGSPVPENSSYKKLIGNTTPDLRGVFLRGKNYDRPTSVGNPEGNLDLGSYRDDMFAKHNHEFGISTVTANYNRAMLYRSEATPTLKTKSGDAGGIETRPRNVTVNYFIKIN